MPEDQRADHWHLVIADGRDVIGGVGAIALLEELRWPLRWLGRHAAGLRLTRAVRLDDDVLGLIRPKLGRFVPDESGPLRYP